MRPEQTAQSVTKLNVALALGAYAVIVYDWFCESAGLPHPFTSGTKHNA